jgi:probable phosphoglycerate mutase
LERASIPAALAAARLGVEHRIDERLVELHFGQAEGLTIDEATERGIEFHFKSETTPVAPDGESRLDILERTRAVDADVIASASRTAVVTHGGVFRSALVDILGLDTAAIWAFHIKNAQLAYVRIVDGRGVLEAFSRLDEPLP